MLIKATRIILVSELVIIRVILATYVCLTRVVIRVADVCAEEASRPFRPSELGEQRIVLGLIFVRSDLQAASVH